jgi:hypothetical protein
LENDGVKTPFFGPKIALFRTFFVMMETRREGCVEAEFEIA